jgi:hypothetical protein
MPLSKVSLAGSAQAEPGVPQRRLGGMLTYPSVARPSRRALGLALPLTLIIAACGAAVAPTTSPGGTPRATPTAVPGGSLQPGAGGNAGGGSDPGAPGDPGTGGGIGIPVPVDPGDDPLLGDATVVTPRAGTIDPRPVNVQLVRAIVDDNGHVIVEARWYSGVEECYPTDSVKVDIDEGARAIKVTVLEGTAGGDVMCIEIAVLKATAVDLGPLAAGTWTISADGEAPAITLDVP